MFSLMLPMAALFVVNVWALDTALKNLRLSATVNEGMKIATLTGPLVLSLGDEESAALLLLYTSGAQENVGGFDKSIAENDVLLVRIRFLTMCN